MYDFLIKRGLSVALLIGFLVSLITIILFITVNPPITGDADIDIWNLELRSAAGFGMICVYIIGFACAGLAIVLPVANSLMTDPKKLLGPVVGLVVLGIIFLIGWAMADNSIHPDVAEFNITPGTSKAVGGSLIAMYIMFVVTIAAALYAEVSKIFK